MSKPAQRSLKSAERAYFLANTPLFLLRKLREDPEIAAIAREANARELLEALKDAVHKNPDDLSDFVWPFVLLVALALKDDGVAMRDATSLEAPMRNDWFDYIRRVLIQTRRSINQSIVDVDSLPKPGVSTANTSPANFVKVPVVQE